MNTHDVVTLETVVGLAEKLSAVEKLKLMEQVLVTLEPIVQSREPKKQKPKGHRGRKRSLTDEQIKEIKYKLWGKDERKWPTRVVQLEGLWKDTPLNLTDEDFRQASHELSEALKRRAEKVL
jgi:predicted double-glycine peptidase